jgi:crossover junction endodeoxyribonuclease RuvC
VDPGTRATGYGVIEGTVGHPRLLECGVIRPDNKGDLTRRLVDIHQGLLELIDRWTPDCVAIEGVYAGQNARTAMVLGHARGVAVLAGALRGLEVLEYPPAEVKKAVVGTGAATKQQVGFMVQQHFRLKEPPHPSDAADGCAVALCHMLAAMGAGGAAALSRGTPS